MVDVGTRVFAEWSPGAWYRGVVAELVGGMTPLALVRFDDGDSGWIEARQIVDERAGKPFPAVGERVLAAWTKSTLYPGRVSGLAGDQLDIAFDDGDRARLPASAVRRLDDVRAVRPITGCRVLARFSNGAYYPGLVEGEAAAAVHVLFDDSDRATVALDGVFVIAGPVPEPAPGAQVLVRRSTGRYAPGVVRVPSRSFVLVASVDGDELMAPIHHVVPHARGDARPAAPDHAPSHHRCAYCQRLSPVGSVQCDHCGAPF